MPNRSSLIGICKKYPPAYYIIKFDKDGKVAGAPGTRLPAVLREGDCIEFNLPSDDFKTKFSEKLGKFDSTFKANYKLLSCKDTVLTYLICKDTDFSCLDSGLATLQDSVNAQKPAFTVSLSNSYTITNTDDIAYEYRQSQSENILISNWLKKKYSLYHGFNIDGYGSAKNCDCSPPCKECKTKPCKDCDADKNEAEFWNLFYRLSSAYTSLNVEHRTLLYATNTEEEDRIDTAIKQAKEISEKLQDLVGKVINANKCWMISWLWYTDGVPMLNPFGISDTTAQSNYLRSRIATLSADMAAYEHTGANGGELGIRKSQQMVIQLARELTFLKARLAQLPALNKAYTDKIAKLSVESKLLYQGEFYVSKPEEVIWMPQYDAANKYKNVVDKQYPSLISELDQMRPLVINLKTKKEVVLEEHVDQLQNISSFERIVADALGKSKVLEGAGILGIQATTSLMKSNPPIVLALDGTTKRLVLNKLASALNEIQLTLTLADWLSQQTAPPTEIELKDGKEPAFRTEWVKPTTPGIKKGSVEVTYGITEKTGSIDKIVVRNETYTQYELTSVVPAAGVVYHFANRYASQFADGTFAEQPFHRVDYLFGIKIYPLKGKTNVQYVRKKARPDLLNPEYNFLRGNNWRNRINFFVGLGTEKVFRNYYLGLGFDVTPFLQIQGGCNWYIQKKYELRNGAIFDSQDKLANGGFYLSATLPASIFAAALKYINPF